MTLWVDGVLVDPTAPVVRADDHGLVVGDGVFETLEVVDGRPFALTRHLRRLCESAAGLGIVVDGERVRAGVAAVVAEPQPARARLRITVTGGPSPYGSDRGDAVPTVLIATAPLSPWPPTADVVIVPWTRNERAATAGLKTTSYADNVVALGWAHERGGDEAIFANTCGDLCEGTGSNVFYVAGDRLCTPTLSSGCLGGITRELLLEWLREDGLVVDEVDAPVEVLRDADEAFLTSSTRGAQPIRAVDGRPLAAAPGDVTRRAVDVFTRRAVEIDP